MLDMAARWLTRSPASVTIGTPANSASSEVVCMFLVGVSSAKSAAALACTWLIHGCCGVEKSRLPLCTGTAADDLPLSFRPLLLLTSTSEPKMAPAKTPCALSSASRLAMAVIDRSYSCSQRDARETRRKIAAHTKKISAFILFQLLNEARTTSWY